LLVGGIDEEIEPALLDRAAAADYGAFDIAQRLGLMLGHRQEAIEIVGLEREMEHQRRAGRLARLVAVLEIARPRGGEATHVLGELEGDGCGLSHDSLERSGSEPIDRPPA